MSKYSRKMVYKESVTPKSLLTPDNCHNSSRIRAFLRLSRIATDDTIRQHLNEVKTSKDCDTYFKSKIVPQWEARASIINYCNAYASNLRQETAKGNAVIQNEQQQQDPQSFDLRVDPYAVKKYNQQLDGQYAQCDAIDNWVNNEKMVEDIIREQTVDVLNDKCYYQDWIEEFKKLKNLA